MPTILILHVRNINSGAYGIVDQPQVWSTSLLLPHAQSSGDLQTLLASFLPASLLTTSGYITGLCGHVKPRDATFTAMATTTHYKGCSKKLSTILTYSRIISYRRSVSSMKFSRENLRIVVHLLCTTGTIVIAIFFVAVGVRVYGLCNMHFVRVYHCHTWLIKVNYCFRRRCYYTSNNVILYSLSSHVRGRFMAVASCYGVFCPLQSVGVINLLSGHHAETLNC